MCSPVFFFLMLIANSSIFLCCCSCTPSQQYLWPVSHEPKITPNAMHVTRSSHSILPGLSILGAGTGCLLPSLLLFFFPKLPPCPPSLPSVSPPLSPFPRHMAAASLAGVMKRDMSSGLGRHAAIDGGYAPEMQQSFLHVRIKTRFWFVRVKHQCQHCRMHG